MLLITGCFIADDLLDDFRKINISLEKSNKVLSSENQLQLMYFYKCKQLNKGIVGKADSVHDAATDASDFIGVLKRILESQDTIGSAVHVASRLLHSQPYHEILRQKVRAVYDCSNIYFVCQHCPAPNVNTAIGSLKAVKTDTAWINKYFGDGTPTMAAVTTLSKLDNDCLTVEKQSLSILKKQLKTK